MKSIYENDEDEMINKSDSLTSNLFLQKQKLIESNSSLSSSCVNFCKKSNQD